SAAGGSRESRQRSAALVFAQTAQSVRTRAGLLRLQLYVLPAPNLAAFLFFGGSSRGFAALRCLHQRAVAVRDSDGSHHRGMARRCPDPTWLEPRARSSGGSNWGN